MKQNLKYRINCKTADKFYNSKNVTIEYDIQMGENTTISYEATIGKKSFVRIMLNNITYRALQLMQLIMIIICINACFNLIVNIKHQLKAENIKQTLNAKTQ